MKSNNKSLENINLKEKEKNFVWSKEQEEAINATGKNITVSASAGAGKTAVLVERLMKRIISDKISVGKIVALTFTDAAAAEMKNRLMHALTKAYSNNPNDEYLKEQITLLPSAKITTIHSFCLSILKDYYYVLQIDPDTLNNILDDATITKVETDTFDYILTNFNQNKLEDTLYHLSGSAMNIDSLKNMVEDLSKQAFSQPNPEQWLDNSIKIYDNFSSLEDLPKEFINLLWTHNDIIVKKLTKSIMDLSNSLDFLNIEENTDNQIKQINTAKVWLKKASTHVALLNDALINQDYAEYKKNIESIARIKHKNVTKKDKFNDLRDQYVKNLQEAVEILYPEKDLLNDLAHNKELAQNIIEIVKIYNSQYVKYKESQNGITFNDMEILTYKLLKKNKQEVAKTLQNEIKDILVDEFQDTNTLQNEIIKLVGRKNNIFRVGDVKQSIYRFRGAKPSLMQDLINKGNTDNHQTIFLRENFRSKDDIVEFNNEMFEKLMRQKTFNSDYTKYDKVSAKGKEHDKDSVPAELHLINTESEAYTDHKGDYDLKDNEFRAEYIANKILSLYNNDKEPKWNKFTVLVNSHASKADLRNAFDQANIPYFIAMPDGFYDSYGVSTVHAFLKLILDPNDAISLTAILINLYGYSENDITELFLIHKDLFKVANTLNKDILENIYYYHQNQSKLNLTSIINEIQNINNFYENKVSEQSRTNLDLFYESAINYQRNHSGIYGFLLEIELMKEEKTSEASSISSEDNVVNVITVHGSKGLQFDTVFLWSRSLNRNLSKSYINSDLGLALKTTYLPKRIIKDNLGNFLIRSLEKKEALEEEMRMLYVALTRAENRLYIVDTFKKSKEKKYHSFDYTDIYNNISYTGWLDAIAQNNKIKHLKVVRQESFTYASLDKPQKDYASIQRFSEEEIKEEKDTYNWPIKPLNLSDEEKHFEVGSMLHDTIEQLPNTIWTKDLIRRINPNISEYFIEKLITLSNNSFFKKINQYTVHKEYPFISNLDSSYHRGIIDYLVEADDKIYIIDFKTDNVQNVNQLIERYHSQLTFYRNAIKPQFKNKDIETYLYSIHLDKFINIQ